MSRYKNTKPVALYYNTETTYLDQFSDVRVRMELAVVALRGKDDPAPDWEVGKILHFKGKNYLIEEVRDIQCRFHHKRVRLRRKDGRFRKGGKLWKEVPTKEVTWKANIIGKEHATISV